MRLFRSGSQPVCIRRVLIYFVSDETRGAKRLGLSTRGSSGSRKFLEKTEPEYQCPLESMRHELALLRGRIFRSYAQTSKVIGLKAIPQIVERIRASFTV